MNSFFLKSFSKKHLAYFLCGHGVDNRSGDVERPQPAVSQSDSGSRGAGYSSTEAAIPAPVNSHQPPLTSSPPFTVQPPATAVSLDDAWKTLTTSSKPSDGKGGS